METSVDSIHLSYIFISFLISLISSWFIFKYVLRIAKMKNIVDNPDARKLQRVPVPVLGGVVVYFGIIVSMIFSELMISTSSFYAVMGAMAIMLYVGTMDDVLSLPWYTRFIVQIMIVLILIGVNNYSLNYFHGLWNLYAVPDYIAISLTVFACVGIINAINLIDGVNGLSSGYCIMACSVFAVFYVHMNMVDASFLAVICIGALITFFIHNVFGEKTRMFIGDGGTLLMGTVMSVLVIEAIDKNTSVEYYFSQSFGVIPFTLAVLALPVFDTLRVMIMRIIRGRSPFSPDKTHFHHLLIDLGFSHIAVTIIEISLNLFIIAAWFLSYKAGASIDGQLYIVVSLSILIVFVSYKILRIQIIRQTKLYHFLLKFGELTHKKSDIIYKFRTFLDKNI